jgi:hypothetical protein
MSLLQNLVRHSSLAALVFMISTAGTNDSSRLFALSPPGNQAAESSAEEVIEMEKQWWEAYKNKDVRWYRENLKSDVVFVNHSGRQTKADMVNSAARGRCEVSSFSLGDFHTIPLAKGVVLLSYQASEDTICDGERSASKVYGTTIYTRDGGRWFVAFAQETVISE